MALKHTHVYLEKGKKVAATLSDLMSCLLKSPHGSPSRNTCQVPVKAVGKVEIPESCSGRRCREPLGTQWQGGDGLVTHA